MTIKHKDNLLENVPHITMTRPYSFHHTYVPAEAESVLYLHWHKEVEFFYIKKGETDFYIEDVKYTLKEGEAIFIPPNLLHMAGAPGKKGCEFYAMVFSTSLLLDYFGDFQYEPYVYPIKHYSLRCPLHIQPHLTWQQEILYILTECFAFTPELMKEWELKLHGLVLILWQNLYNNHLCGIDAAKQLSKLAEHLKPSLLHLHNNYGEEIRLKELAALCHLSEGQFCKLFKQLTGFTPFAYLNRYRIIKSCEYLAQSDKKVTEIAALSGFNNISFYNREFMKYMKLTPSVYRKTAEKS